MASVAPGSGATRVLRWVAALPVQLFLYTVSAGVVAALTIAAGWVWVSAALGRRR